jgi:hypothetical protein
MLRQSENALLNNRPRGAKLGDHQVPAQALRRASLSKIEITLFRVKDRPTQRMSGAVL